MHTFFVLWNVRVTGYPFQVLIGFHISRAEPEVLKMDRVTLPSYNQWQLVTLFVPGRI